MTNKILRSIYALIAFSQVLGWIYIMEKVLYQGLSGMAPSLLLFVFPAIFVVAWAFMISD